jgi:hypothetical protein
MLGPGRGLGTHKTAAKHTQDGIALVQREVIAVAIRFAIQHGLPLAMAVDESPTCNLGGRPILMVHIFHAGLSDTLCVDIAQLSHAPTATRLAEGIKSIMVRQEFLTEQEFETHVQVLAGDHASYVKKASKDMGLDFSGDPPHALDLMLKAILKASGLKSILMAIRALLNGKSYIVARAAAAFGIPPSAYKVPTHRWGYFMNLCILIATPRSCTQLQQLLVWMAISLYGGKAPLDTSYAELFADIPFTASQMSASATAPTRSDSGLDRPDSDVLYVDGDDDDGDDWDDSVVEIDESDDPRDSSGANDSDGNQLESGDPSAGLSPSDGESDDDTRDTGKSDAAQHSLGASASLKQRRLQSILRVLRMVCNPVFLSYIRCICEIANPLRVSQQQMQRADGRSPDVLAAMRGAYDSLANFLKAHRVEGRMDMTTSPQQHVFLRLATVTDTQAEIDANADYANADQPTITLLAHVTEREHDYVVNNTGDAFARPTFTVKYINDSMHAAIMSMVHLKALKAAKAAFAKCEAHGMNALAIAQRRHTAALNMPFQSIDLAPMLVPKQAGHHQGVSVHPLPPDMRDGRSVPATAAMQQDFDFDDANESPTGPTTTINLAIMGEWRRLLDLYKTMGSACFVSSREYQMPHEYWIRVADLLPRLSRVMLFWLTFPVGTSNVERSFSFMTIVSRNARRRRLSFAAFRAAVLSFCFKKEINSLLQIATSTSK